MTQKENRRDLPAAVEREIGALLSLLSSAGWIVETWNYDPEHFGNWWTCLHRGSIDIRLVKDRSQYYIDGPVDSIKAGRLWKALGNLDEFREAVTAWAATHQG